MSKDNFGCDEHMKLEIVWTWSIWPKGQIVIPKAVRDKVGLKPWDNIVVLLKDGKYIWLAKNDDMTAIMKFINN